MVITLYKGCRLNKTYCEVLDTIAPHTYDSVLYNNTLDAYLSSLEKFTVSTLEDVYGTNRGTFTFQLELEQSKNLYEYNYMKVLDSTGKFSRYYFINSITVCDILGLVDYDEDIWANYSSSMHVRKSLLTRSRSLKYGNYTIPFYKLGMDYESNNFLSYSSLKTVYDATDLNIGKCSIVVQMQMYQLAIGTGGVASVQSNIISRTVCIRKNDIDNDMIPIDTDLFDLLTKLKAGQSSKKFVFNSTYKNTYNISDISTSSDWYYEIGNVYLVPHKFNFTLENVIGYTMGTIEDLAGFTIADVNRSFYIQSGALSNGRPVLCTTSTITKDFKKIGVGTYSNLYEVVQNGTDVVVGIAIGCDDFNFNIYLNVQNQLINITDNYFVDIPISAQTADVTQQAKTSRQLEIMNSSFQIGKGVLNLYSGINSITSGAAEAALGASKGQIGNAVAGKGMIASGVKETYRGVVNIAQGIADLVVLNRPLYRTNKGTFSRSIGITNAYEGMFVFSINADNETEVQANIDNAGYIVNEVVGDLLQIMANDNNKPTYNVMSFGFVNNYGYFTEEIRQELANMLSNGIKIWYDASAYINS